MIKLDIWNTHIFARRIGWNLPEFNWIGRAERESDLKASCRGTPRSCSDSNTTFTSYPTLPVAPSLTGTKQPTTVLFSTRGRACVGSDWLKRRRHRNGRAGRDSEDFSPRELPKVIVFRASHCMVEICILIWRKSLSASWLQSREVADDTVWVFLPHAWLSVFYSLFWLWECLVPMVAGLSKISLVICR